MDYARQVPGGRVHHLVKAGQTLCGRPIETGWAVWPARLNTRVDPAPLCEACRLAASAVR